MITDISNNLFITKTILNGYLNEISSDSVSFYRYFICNFSLVSREWRDHVVPKLQYKNVLLQTPEHMPILLDWIDRGFNFSNILFEEWFPNLTEEEEQTQCFEIIRHITKAKEASDLEYIKTNLEHLVISLSDFKNISGWKKVGMDELNMLIDIKTRFPQISYDRLYMTNMNFGPDEDYNSVLGQLNLARITHDSTSCVYPLNLPMLRKLEICNPALGNLYQSFESIVKNCQSLESLSISSVHGIRPNANVDPSHTLFTDSLAHHPNLTSLKIVLRIKETSKNVIDFLNTNTVLKSFQFNLNMMGSMSDVGSEKLIKNSTLKKIQLDTHERDWKSLLQSWEGSNLEIIKTASSISLPWIVESHNRITRLHLTADRYIPDKWLEFLPNLTYLEVTNKQIEGENHFQKQKDITSSIIAHKTIKDLSLKNVDPIWVNQIIKANHPTIKTLSIDNELYDFFEESLATNTTITSLNITRFSGSLKQTLNLVGILKRNQTIRKFSDISQFEASYNTLEQIDQLWIEYFKTHPNPIHPENIDTYHTPSYSNWKYLCNKN